MKLASCQGLSARARLQVVLQNSGRDVGQRHTSRCVFAAKPLLFPDDGRSAAKIDIGHL